MGVLTSKLILELLDRVTGPARKVSASLTALTAMQAKNSARLAALQGKLLGAAAAGYGLAKGLASPIKAGAEFQTMLEDIRQKSGVSGEALAELGRKLRGIATATNQLPTDTIKTFDELLGLGLGGTNDENVAAALKMLPAINRVATAYLLARAPAMSGADVADWIVRCIPATPAADAVPDYVARRASMHVVARSHPEASTTDSDDRPAADGAAGD